MNKKIIYVVTKGEYSDYRICGVFDNKPDASYVAAKYDGEVETYSLNPAVCELRKGYTGFIVRMERDGTTDSVEEWEDFIAEEEEEPTFFPLISWMVTNMYAKDAKHAVKIANERRTRMIAEGRWPSIAEVKGE